MWVQGSVSYVWLCLSSLQSIYVAFTLHTHRIRINAQMLKILAEFHAVAMIDVAEDKFDISAWLIS